MSTRLTWSRAGLVLRCETSKRPLPRTAWAFALPPFALVNTVSPGITTAFVYDSAGLPSALRVTNLEELAAGYSYTLNWASYEGAEPGTLQWNAIQLGQVRGFSQMLALGLSAATILIYLSRTWSGIREDYAQVTVSSPGVSAPDQPSGLAAYVQAENLYLGWLPVADDFGSMQYEVRWGESPEAAQRVGRTYGINMQLPSEGQYWVAALRFGKYSAWAGLLVGSVAFQRNIVQTWDERATGWSGTLGGSALVDGTGNLSLGSETLFDAPTEDFDDALGYFDAYGGVGLSGVYEVPASHIVDIGKSQLCTVVCSYALAGIAANADWDDGADFDAGPDLDGAFGGYVSVFAELAIAGDDGVFGDWLAYVPGSCQYPGRKFKMRFTLRTTDPEVIPVVSALTWTVDMPDRTESKSGVAVSSAGATIAYSTAFQQRPVTHISIRNAALGDYFKITADDRFSFTVTCYDSTNTAVARSINWSSRGF